MHCRHLRRVDSIFVDHSASCKLRHCNDMVGIHHSVFLDGEHRGIRLPSRTVELGCMHMNHERFAGNILCMYSGGICEPVVGMDYIEIHGACYDPSHD